MTEVMEPNEAEIFTDHCIVSFQFTSLAGVADYIPKTKLKGRNPVPWINGPILTLIKKKESMHKNLILSPSSFLKAKFKDLRSKVKRMPREARASFLAGMESQLKCNPKRFWSTLKMKSKHRGISKVITMATGPSGDPADGRNRTQASSPAEIVDLFNRCFVSVFTSDPVTCKIS